MKKTEIIKKSYEFSKIINKRNAIKNKYFSIFYQPNQEKTTMASLFLKKQEMPLPATKSNDKQKVL